MVYKQLINLMDRMFLVHTQNTREQSAHILRDFFLADYIY